MSYIHPRRKRTREKLKNALIDIARTGAADKLAVQALRRHADVGHTTFYRHYKGLDDLLGSVLFPPFEELRQRVRAQETLYDEALVFFGFIKDYEDLYRLRLLLPKDNSVRRKIDQRGLKLIAERWERHDNSAVPFELSFQIVESLTYRLAYLYLENIDTYTPEHMASMYYDLVLKMAASTMKLRDGWVLKAAS